MAGIKQEYAEIKIQSEGNHMRLKDKVALVTGGGDGIGAGITARFVEEGARVLITGRRKQVLQEFASRFPSGKVDCFAADVSKPEDVEQSVKAAIKFGGTLDILVNNAGISQAMPIDKMELEEWNRMLAVNLTGPMLMMKYAIRHMREHGGGSIINIASIGAFGSLPAMPAYAATKAALVMLTKQAALDYTRDKIRINVVCPGGVRTTMLDKEFGQIGSLIGMNSDEFIETIAAELPMQRFADISEIGSVCAFLASDDASFISGSSIVADGAATVPDVAGAIVSSMLRRGKKEGG